MYFTIKYIDFDEFERTKIQEEQDLNAPILNENKRLLVNPDCPVGIIREYIANALLLRGDDIASFELYTEKGSIMKTSQTLPAVNGLELLKEKEIYYVILASNVENSDTIPILTPLLNKFSKEFLDFMAQQKRKSGSIKSRKSTSSKLSSKEATSCSSKTPSQTTT